MSTDVEKPIPLKLRVLHVLRLLLARVARFFFGLYYGNEGQKIPPIIDDILKESTVEVARKIREKEITSVGVLAACVRRIKDVNSALNCFVEDRYDLALREAKRADELIRSGDKTPAQLEKEQPLLGVPFTTKDCIAVKGILSVLCLGLHNTAGVVLRKDVIADEDADAIRLLREKGAIIIGLTNVPELCMWWETHNHIHGKTNNPYNTTRIVGGSSGGEGALQGAAGSIFGVGSDIGGSIRMPSYFNGVFGHKTSRHIVSNKGQYPRPENELQNSFLSIGPLVRHAVDLKLLLKIMSGENASKLKLDEPVDIKKLKFYYQFSNEAPLTDPVDPDIITAMKKVVEYLKEEHQLIAEEKKMSILKKSLAIWFATMKSNKKFGEFIMENESIGNILKEIVKNIFGLSGNTLIGLVTSLFDYGGVKIGGERHKYYINLRNQLEETFKEMLGENGVFLYPVHPTPAPYHNEPLIRPFNFSYTAIVNCLGLPATTIPLGLSRDGLPIGIQVIANYNQDRLCLAVAEELDRAFGGWLEPQKS